MLFRLTMPPINRMVRTGTITRWLKSEGERVEYGDDLFEARVEIERRRFVYSTVAARIRRLTQTAPLRAKDFMPAQSTHGPAFHVRITASDTGVLQRIYTREAATVAVGDLLALLTSESTEPLDETPQAVTRASAFRVVTNVPEAP